MDTISIAPAPQHNAPSAKTPRGAAGAGTESGFGRVLEQAATADDPGRQAPMRSGQNEQRKDTDADRTASAPLDDTPRNIGTDDAGNDATVVSDTAVRYPADTDPVDTDPGAAAVAVAPNLLTLLFGTSGANGGRQQTPLFWQSPAGPMLSSPLQALTEAGATIELPATGQKGLTVAIENGANQMLAPATGRQMDALLAQLQALISGNNDQVTVTAAFQSTERTTLPGYLSGPLVTALLAEANASTAQQQAQPLTGLPGEQPPVSVDALLQKNGEPPVTPLRQQQAGPELHSRLAIFQSNSGEQKNEQGGRQQSMQHQATAGQQTATTLLPQVEANGTTSHGFTAQFQEAATQQAAAASRLSGQPSSAPGGQHVAEGDVIGQIIQRFSLQTNLQTSRLNLKLHPAELGELKISLVVKEDSLKANIYAQTRQAQEIIEKHLPRLKSVLEEQGLVVEDLLVTLESEFLEDSTSQQGQSFAEQMTDFGREQGGQGNNDLFRTSLEEVPATTAEHDQHAPSGVNLTV